MSVQDVMLFQKGECVYFDAAYERGMCVFAAGTADLDVMFFPQ